MIDETYPMFFEPSSFILEVKLKSLQNILKESMWYMGWFIHKCSQNIFISNKYTIHQSPTLSSPSKMEVYDVLIIML
jgi:hypothetical protein